jgi:hypothetical protein
VIGHGTPRRLGGRERVVFRIDRFCG